ncbi:hypothetical protein [Peptoniphilus lacydonensis]|uniref:hypothetical protein n=1 Tax=Peptoniphilus lacydonensis TaxID=1673725 RepID=UPI0008D91818|nr:hypothetical protein [Peptoniphilus lacydonensis]
MTNLNKMYDGVVNSPETYLTQNLAADATIIYVADGSVFGSLPNLAVIGTDQTAETILVEKKRSDGGYNVKRSIEGNGGSWTRTTPVARNFTNFDYQQIKDNIEKLNKGKQESLTAGTNIQIVNGKISATDTKYDDTQIKKDITELQNSQLSKASQKEAESGVDNTKYMTPQATKQAIEKLSPKQDLSGYAMKKDIKIKLSEMEEDSTHRTVTNSEKEKWNKKFDLPAGKENQVLTKTTNGAEFKNISSSRSATFVIANYDSSENSKSGADYIIQESDCAAEIINDFITKLPEYGGKIQLTEGNFNIKKNLAINFTKNNTIIEGYGDSTNIIDKLTKDERNSVIVNISTGIENCRLSDLNITHDTSNSINIKGNKNYIKNVNVINNGTHPSVYVNDNTSENILENCSVKGASSTCFFINGSNNSFSNCSGASTSNGFLIDGSNNSFSNCSGASTNQQGLVILGLNHSLSNCSGTSTSGTPIYIDGKQVNLIGCTGKSVSTNRDIWLTARARYCLALGNRYYKNLDNQGTNNIIANNIKLEV